MSNSPTIPSNTLIRVTPQTVEYRSRVARRGVRVVRVYLATKTPRFLSYTETATGFSPLPLFLDEILAYIEDAQTRIRKETKR